MQEMLEKLYSGNKDKVNEAVKEIGKLKEGNETLLREILKMYNPNEIESIKVTIRGINAGLFFCDDYEIIEKYKNILLNNITSSSGLLRRLIYSMMNTFRIKMPDNTNLLRLFGCAPHKLSSGEIELKNKLNRLNLEFYMRLTKLYEQEKNEKVRKSILLCILQFHCISFHEVIKKAGYGEIYEQFCKIRHPKYREFY